MKKLMTAAFALSALFAASGKVHADVNYPWYRATQGDISDLSIIGENRGVECVYSSREQCTRSIVAWVAALGGNGGHCIQNPAYKQGPPTVSGKKRTETARPHPRVTACTEKTHGIDGPYFDQCMHETAPRCFGC
jgi:hypothetical protein